MRQQGDLTGDCAVSQRRLAGVVRQFEDDGYWENFMALGLSSHVDGNNEAAIRYYEQAIHSVTGDVEFMRQPGTIGLVDDIQGQIEKARTGQGV